VLSLSLAPLSQGTSVPQVRSIAFRSVAGNGKEQKPAGVRPKPADRAEALSLQAGSVALRLQGDGILLDRGVSGAEAGAISERSPPTKSSKNSWEPLNSGGLAGNDGGKDGRKQLGHNCLLIGGMLSRHS